MNSVYRYFTHLFTGIFFIFFIQFSVAQIQTFKYNDSWSEQGVKLLSSDDNHLRINVSINQFQLVDQMVEKEVMKSVKLQDVLLQGNEGSPDLPVYSHYIAIPQGASVTANIVNKRTDIRKDILVSPAPKIPLDTDLEPLQFEKNKSVYGKNEFYPEKISLLSSPRKIRGVDVVLISISPFQYNPVTKELLIHRDIELELTFDGGNGHFGEDRFRNRWWDPIINDMVLNDNVIPETNHHRKNNRAETGCDYLIITPDDNTFQAWADSIRRFRVRQGISTKVVNTTEIGGNTASAIESYIDDAYNNWDIPPVAVLLMADYGNSGSSITSPVYNSYCISDNIYADVDNDHLPDIIFARMTAQNEGHLETMVTKFLNYERTPPTNTDFYKHPITAMGWQTERWFQLCSEIIAGFFENELGKSAVRENAIYSGNPGGGVWSTATNTNTILSVFGEDGLGYIPDSPDYLDDWGGNASRINSDINSGAFILQHRDHGFTGGWGEPAYSSADIDGLSNEDLTFVFSVNCLTGKFNEGGECFAEKFHRHEYGALGIIAATEVSYSFVNDAYVWGMYDNLWPDFMPQFETEPESRDVLPAFGNAAGKYFLEQSSWPSNTGNKQVTYHLFHHHGDAFSTVYYNTPQYLDVDHDEVLLSGMDLFNITVDVGAYICLSIDEVIIATAEGTGNEQEISILPQDPGTIIDIVITKQNFYRYENKIEVIPPDGPYCMYDGHILNDTCGNGNNKAEFDESILFSMAMKNLGSEDANNVEVTLSSTDNYVEFIDSIEDFDTIRSGGSAERNLAFRFHLSDGIPDQHNIRFDITAKDENDSVWQSKCFMVVSAPKVVARNLIVVDSEFGNGNGRLDPGETADIKIKMVNDGHCKIENVVCSLVAYNQFINVEVDEQVIPYLNLFVSEFPTFRVTVDDDAPVGAIAQMNYHVSSAGYSINKIFYPKIGLFLEDFETGNFDKYDWSLGGDMPWGISGDYPYEGYLSARSGVIGNNQTSSFSISYQTMSDDDIKFAKKVSSELDGDKLNFYIDGQLRGSWSGTSQGWTQESFPVPAGVHSFKWEYKKNSTGESGSDCAWVDYIELPTELFSTVFAGPDDESCIDGLFQCIGMVSNQDSLLWSTSGDGSFNDPGIRMPMYTPGENDLQNGTVNLSLKNFDLDGETVLDEMMLSFIDIPVAPAQPAGPDLIDVYKDSETNYTILPVLGAGDYNWVINPVEAGYLFTNDTLATIYWNSDFFGEVSLKVAAVGECGESDFSDELLVLVDNTVGATKIKDDVHIGIVPNPNNGQFRLFIKSENKNKLNILLFNALGTEVFSQFNIPAGNSFVKELNFQGLPHGMYILVINQGTDFYTKKILISK